MIKQAEHFRHTFRKSETHPQNPVQQSSEETQKVGVKEQNDCLVPAGLARVQPSTCWGHLWTFCLGGVWNWPASSTWPAVREIAPAFCGTHLAQFVHFSIHGNHSMCHYHLLWESKDESGLPLPCRSSRVVLKLTKPKLVLQACLLHSATKGNSSVAEAPERAISVKFSLDI